MNVGAFYLETLDHTDRIDLTDPLVTSHDMTARLEVSTTLNNTFNVVVADVVDLAQNTTTLVLTASIVLDTRPPRAPTLRGFSHLLNTTSVVINLSAEADSTTRLYVDGQTLSNSLSPNDTITLSLNEGFHYFALRSTDRAGNESLVQNDSVTIDITPAQVTTWSIEGLNILKAGQYSVTLGFSEAIVSIGSIALESSDTGFRYTVDGTGHLTITSLQDGIYDLVIQHIRDVAGNVSSVVISAALTVDTTPPDAPQFLTFAAIMNTVNFKSSFLTEEQALISVIVDGHPRPSLYQAHDDCQLTLSEGQHQVSLLAYDPAQNVSATQNYTITIDLTPPTLNKIGPVSYTHLTLPTIYSV